MAMPVDGSEMVMLAMVLLAVVLMVTMVRRHALDLAMRPPRQATRPKNFILLGWACSIPLRQSFAWDVGPGSEWGMGRGCVRTLDGGITS
jgi:hypothetical protein